jgi:hypothetical protein
MTSNLGARDGERSRIGFDNSPNKSASYDAVNKHFTPEFRNRLDSIIEFNMAATGTGSFQEGEVVFQGYSLDSASATAVVLYWDSDRNVLAVKDLIGNFVTSNPIYGRTTGASRIFQSYKVTPQKLSQVTVTPDPYTANANSNYTYMVRTEVYPDIGDNEDVITFDSSTNTMDKTTITMDESY